MDNTIFLQNAQELTEAFLSKKELQGIMILGAKTNESTATMAMFKGNVVDLISSVGLCMKKDETFREVICAAVDFYRENPSLFERIK
jgi:hypothetical protein|nr:MAG TPA: hypothetical protein [Caudoviricetes sp.]